MVICRCLLSVRLEFFVEISGVSESLGEIFAHVIRCVPGENIQQPVANIVSIYIYTHMTHIYIYNIYTFIYIYIYRVLSTCMDMYRCIYNSITDWTLGIFGGETILSESCFLICLVHLKTIAIVARLLSSKLRASLSCLIPQFLSENEHEHACVWHVGSQSYSQRWDLSLLLNYDA